MWKLKKNFRWHLLVSFIPKINFAMKMNKLKWKMIFNRSSSYRVMFRCNIPDAYYYNPIDNSVLNKLYNCNLSTNIIWCECTESFIHLLLLCMQMHKLLTYVHASIDFNFSHHENSWTIVNLLWTMGVLLNKFQNWIYFMFMRCFHTTKRRRRRKQSRKRNDNRDEQIINSI